MKNVIYQDKVSSFSISEIAAEYFAGFVFKIAVPAFMYAGFICLISFVAGLHLSILQICMTTLALGAHRAFFKAYRIFEEDGFFNYSARPSYPDAILITQGVEEEEYNHLLAQDTPVDDDWAEFISD